MGKNNNRGRVKYDFSEYKKAERKRISNKDEWKEKDWRDYLIRLNSKKVHGDYLQLGREALYYLKKYPESAIDFLERIIFRKYNNIPSDLQQVYLEAADYYQKKENFEAAEKLVMKILASNNIQNVIRTKGLLKLIQEKKALSIGEFDEEAIIELEEIAQQDEKNELGTAKPRKFTDFDFFCTYFGEKIPVSGLIPNIFPYVQGKSNDTKDVIENEKDKTETKRIKQYSENLSAKKRLEFFVNNFKISSASFGDGKYKGTVIFELEDSDFFIVESFWREDRDGNKVEDYGKATYILPKDIKLDLLKLSRGELAGKNDDRIISARHTEHYYDNLLKKFNKVKEAMLNGTGFEDLIEEEEIPKQSNEGDVIEEKQRGGVEKEQDEDDKKKEKTTSDTENHKTNKIEQKNYTEKNREFLISVNENIGQIISPEIMEELLKRASYSFEDVYNNKLKEKIMEKLRKANTPEDKIEIEAQKVFIYIRITKSLSEIKASIIRGEKLDNIIDNSILEYQTGLEFLEKHKDNYLTYKELRKAMIAYVEKEKAFVEQEQQDSSNGIDNSTDEKEKVIEDPIAIEVENIVEQYTELLIRLREIETESARLDCALEKAKEEFELLRQETNRAKEAEEKAKLATQEAMNKEEKSNKKIGNINEQLEQLRQEEKELKAMKSKITSVFGGGSERRKKGGVGIDDDE